MNRISTKESPLARKFLPTFAFVLSSDCGFAEPGVEPAIAAFTIPSSMSAFTDNRRASKSGTREKEITIQKK